MELHGVATMMIDAAKSQNGIPRDVCFAVLLLFRHRRIRRASGLDEHHLGSAGKAGPGASGDSSAPTAVAGDGLWHGLSVAGVIVRQHLLTAISHRIAGDLKVVGFAVDLIVSFAVFVALFAMIFKFLPDVRIQLGDVAWGQ